MEEEKSALVQSLIDMVSEIASISEYKCTVKKQYCNLARRLKLLTPMFEELRDSKEALPEDTMKALVSFMDALKSAKDLLRFGSEGSKIYLVCALLLASWSFSTVCICGFLYFNLSSPWFFFIFLVWLWRKRRKVKENRGWFIYLLEQSRCSVSLYHLGAATTKI